MSVTGVWTRKEHAVKARPRGRSGRASGSHGGILLGRREAERLRAALEQADLLLATKQIDVGLCTLVDLLRNLRALRRFVA
jgi:hypothetical protein